MAITQRMIPNNLRGLDFKVMASFAGADVGSKASMRIRNLEVNPAIMAHAMPLQKSAAARGPDMSILGGKSLEASLETPLRGGALVAGGVSTSEIMSMIQYWGATVNKRAAAAAGIDAATADTITGTIVNIGTIEVGDMIMVYGGSTDAQMRVVTKVTDSAPDTTLTVYPDFTDTPSNGDSVMSVDTLTPTVGEASGYLALDAFFGQGATNRFALNLLGCVGTWEIPSVKAGDVPFLKVGLMGDRWTASEDNRAQAADLFEEAHPVLSSTCYFDDDTFDIESLAFNPGLKPVEMVSTAGANGRSGYLYTDPEPTLEIMPYHTNDFYTYWAAETEKAFFFSSVLDEEHAWALWIPKVQIVNIGMDALGNDHMSAKPELAIVDPGANADDTDYPLFSFALIGGGP